MERKHAPDEGCTGCNAGKQGEAQGNVCEIIALSPYVHDRFAIHYTKSISELHSTSTTSHARANGDEIVRQHLHGTRGVSDNRLLLLLSVTLGVEKVNTTTSLLISSTKSIVSSSLLLIHLSHETVCTSDSLYIYNVDESTV